MEIRDIKRQDVAQVRKIALSTFVSLQEKFYFILSLNFRKSIFKFKIAIIDDEIVGLISTIYLRNEWHIANIAVIDGHQRMGIATKLIGSAVKSVLSVGGSVIVVHVRESNFRAINLYEKLDFKQVSLKENYYPTSTGKKENAIILKNYL